MPWDAARNSDEPGEDPGKQGGRDFTPRVDKDVKALKEGDLVRLTDEIVVILQGGEYQLFTLSGKIEVK